MTTDPKATPAASAAKTPEAKPATAPSSARPAPAPPVRPAAKPAPTPPAPKARPVAKPAQMKRRHLGLILSFAFMVLVPASLSALYLYIRGVDQYASTLGFTVRSEDISSASDLLGGLSSTLGGSGSRDTDILYEYIRSQEIVAAIDADLDLKALYSRHYDTDPVLSFDPEGTIEDLTDYWQNMVRISYDAGAGLMDLRVLAFTPEDARDIAQAIYDESLRTINALSAIAREDATRYAREDLEKSIERLKLTREAITAFRIESQIVDVSADIQSQMGLLSTLQTQLAAALIEFDLLSSSVRDDPRLVQAQRRIEVIEARIKEERLKFGASGQSPSGESYADTVATFERLTVDREVAERTYVAALSGYDAAVAEANRQSLYLAAYIRPTLAEKSEFPQRELIIGLVALFSFLLWAILFLVYYSLRDRR